MDAIPQEVIDNPDFQHDIYTAAIDYEMFVSDGWRCDFCEPNCTCDQDYLRDKAEQIATKRLGAKFSSKAVDEIENLILDRRLYG